MYNILLVDDDKKYQNTVRESFSGINDLNLISAVNGPEALAHLNKYKIDLIIVDYLLGPPYNGDELIRIIKRTGDGKFKNIPIIFNTGSLGENNLNHTISTVNADDANKKGESSTSSLLAKIYQLLTNRNYSSHSHFLQLDNNCELDDSDITYSYSGVEWYDPVFPEFNPIKIEKCNHINIDLLLMVATVVELKQVLRLLQPLSRRKFILQVNKDIETYFIGKFGAFDTCVTQCTMGSDGAAGATLTASGALKLWKPKCLVMVGICFARDKKKHLPADIILPNHLKLYENQRVSSGGIVFRGECPPVSPLLFNRFRNALNWKFLRPDGTKINIHEGPMLSGNKLIDDVCFKKSLLDQYKDAIAGEMEGAGIHASATRTRTDWILIKAVSDWGDGKKHKEYQPMAAAAAASLAHHVFSNINVLD